VSSLRLFLSGSAPTFESCASTEITPQMRKLLNPRRSWRVEVIEE
jgi:hypothetical protein